MLDEYQETKITDHANENVLVLGTGIFNVFGILGTAGFSVV